MQSLIVKKKDKLAYFSMPKVASSSIPRTFFSSLGEIERYEEEIRKKINKSHRISGWNITLSTARPIHYLREYTLDLPTLASFTYTYNSKAWHMSGYDEKTETFQSNPITEEDMQSYFTFTFVRNPFARLVSCFQNKFLYDEKDKLYHAHFRMNMGDKRAFKGFADMLSTIALQENHVMEEHFRPQSNLLDMFRQAGGKINFIGKLENIEKDFAPLQKKYNLLPLERLNDSAEKNTNVHHKDWRDYYTPELTKLVYDRWHDDFVQFGYENEYASLLAHLGAPLPVPLVRLIARKKEKVAYFPMHKVGSVSIPRTFFPSVAERTYWDAQAEKASGGKSNFLGGWRFLFSIIAPNMVPFKINFSSPDILGFHHLGAEKGWEVRGYDEKTKSIQGRPMTKEEVQSYFTFTFVRNPFRRLVSFFQNKLYYNEEEKLYRSIPVYKDNDFALKGFSDLIEQIAMQEDERMDQHFRPQSSVLDKFYQVDGKIDFMGKLENIEEDFKGLQEKYNLLPLEWLNVSRNKNANVSIKDWRDYYTPETARLVYDRWREDFVQLGYEMEYPKLLTYLGAPLPLRFRKRQLFAKLGFPAYKKYRA